VTKFIQLFSISLLFTSAGASASYICKTDDGKTEIVVEHSFQIGDTATVKSTEIAEFYKQKNLSLSTLETVIDPDAHRAASSVKANGEIDFMLYAPNSGTDAVWGLKFAHSLEAEVKSAKAIVIDQEGKAFGYDLVCESGPDLE